MNISIRCAGHNPQGKANLRVGKPLLLTSPTPPQMHNPPQRFCAGEGFFVFLVYSRNFRINSFREAG